MQLRSIKQKIAVMAGCCLLCAAGVLVVYGVIAASRTQSFVSERVGAILNQGATRNLEALAASQAAIVQSALQDNLDVARTTAKVFEVLRTRVPNAALRDTYNAILLANLENNPEYLGSYSAWEPNALDGNDAKYANTPGHDATGRFIPYWNRDPKGNIARQPLVEYESNDKHPNGVRKGGWYLGPRETGKESVLDPFPYIVQGQQDWLTTLSVPVKRDGKFLGVSGTDLRLGFLQELAGNVNKNLYGGKGEVLIISYDGMVVANSSDSKTIGQPISTLFKDSQHVLENVQNGKSAVDMSEDKSLMLTYAPIKLGRTGKPWSVLIRLPSAVVLADAHALDADLTSRARQGAAWQIGFGLIVALAGIAVLWFFAETLTKPLRMAAGYAGKVAEGDFSQQLDIRQNDEIGILATALRTMVENLKAKIAEAEAKGEDARRETENARQAMAQANEAKAQAERAKAEGMMQAAAQLEKVVEVVSSASEELSAQVEQSSRGTEVQSSRVAETATAMEEMNSTVLEVARNASQAAESTESARKQATDGAAIVSQVVSGIGEMQRVSQAMKQDMEALGKQAEGIGQIMNVISDIADQTNLLALNAAIEAARAGDAGRGFAVVADEVRKLAEKTMDATKEVGEAISGIQHGTRKNLENVDRSAKTVEQATQLANRSGEALTQIVRMVETATDQVRSIATASEEQSSTSEEINRSIEDINRISRETSDAMRQSAQAVGELAVQTQSLRSLIEKMKQGG
ncbi:methyl-accepting chemotaxis sensory transducer with Cache sensor [Humidesulfovibrio mexicanus]|uniref:Methyl-accepting chemotaxis sensory transducer with Cache sensor n=1 Tax=Humidesulfovibrio mexicanus TaxID=147047 RepID=A0A238Y2Z6_9BACT|nr:methyl-accepting chemotaxis sensory transducer with Cache sensor [Humidesulfovibrio mexicanus]